MKSSAWRCSGAAAVLSVVIGGGACGAGRGTLVGTGGTAVSLGGSGGQGVVLGAGGAGATTTGAGGVINNCGARSLPAQKVAPDIMILLDASASMNEPISPSCTAGCPGPTKWAAAVDAIDTVVDATTTQVDWGLMLMAGAANACDIGDLGVGVGANDAIRVALARRTSGGTLTVTGNRPTRAAVTGAASSIAATLSPVRPSPERVILLITDGAPNCNPGAPDGLTDDTAGTVNAMTAVLESGVYTFVVGLATSGPAAMALDQLATSGGMPRAGFPAYYPASSSADLIAAMNALVASTAGCLFAVPPPPTNDGVTSRSSIGVVVGSQQIPQDAMNGWTYTDTTLSAIQLHGASCDTVRNTDAAVSVIFHCVLP